MGSKAFRNGLSFGIISFLIGGPVIAGILFALSEFLNLLHTYGRWIFTVTLIILLVFPLTLWRKGRAPFVFGYFAGFICCLVLTYLAVRIFAWAIV